MKLTDILEGIPFYVDVMGNDTLHDLLVPYLDVASSQAIDNDEDVNQGEIVKQMIGQDDLSSRSIIFHEMVEILAYLEKGYTPEEVASFKAHDENYMRAHNLAEGSELYLLGEVSKAVYGEELPHFVLFGVRPALLIFDYNLEQSYSRIQQYAPRNVEYKSEFNMDIQSYIHWTQRAEFSINDEDVERGFELFEAFGNVYYDEDKVRLQRFVHRQVDRINFLRNHYNKEAKDFEIRSARNVRQVNDVTTYGL